MYATNSLTLTDREREIGHMWLDGHKAREIAEQLRLSEMTVRTYRQRLCRKLGIRSRQELRAYRDLFQE